MSTTINQRLKTLIAATLKLDGVAADDIPDDEPLIGSPRLGLDSLDALELVLAIEKEFGVKIGSSEESRKALGSVNTLAAYLRTCPVGSESVLGDASLSPGDHAGSRGIFDPGQSRQVV